MIIRVIIIGSVPAALTAAIYAARGRIEPVVRSGNQSPLIDIILQISNFLDIFS